MGLEELLRKVYNESESAYLLKEIASLKDTYSKQIDRDGYQLSEKDIVLITYGDQLYKDQEAKLRTLNRFMDDFLKPFINSVHILPFYPYTSDDGFSVVDYYEVNPELGNWAHIESMAKSSYRIMFDAVINHISQESEWFKGYLAGESRYEDYFIDEESLEGWEQVVRPRTSPLLHEFEGRDGNIKNVWTTFSQDQVDLNYKNPRVLLHILDLLLFYISRGAGLIRLDAIGFMWKEKNTTCIHLEQTHNIIKAMRKVIEELSLSTVLITETNVPHQENISYFGNGLDEAHMVYNFTLPPLMAHGLLSENASQLTQWASTLDLPGDKVCFFNFGSSHDGVGLRPLDGIISKDDLNVLLRSAESNGGYVSYKSNSDGTESPYEINCNYFSLLKGVEQNESIGISRMILSQAVILAMPGVPALYFHSIVGSENYNKGVEETGRYRTINREKLEDENLRNELTEEGSVRFKIFNAIKNLAEIRKSTSAFHPFGSFGFPSFDERVFAIERVSPDKTQKVLALHNFSNNELEIDLSNYSGVDLISGKSVGGERDTLKPYEVIWLEY